MVALRVEDALVTHEVVDLGKQLRVADVATQQGHRDERVEGRLDGAQGLAGLFVERIEGSFSNVMGLPVCRLGNMLKKVGVELL